MTTSNSAASIHRPRSQPPRANALATIATNPAIALSWLLLMRWWLAGLMCGVLAASEYVFPLGLPIAPILGCAAAVALTNAGLVVWQRRARSRMPQFVPAALLLIDVSILTVVLALSGGSSNPFTAVYLVFVTVAAAALSARWTWAVVVLSAIGYGALFFFDSGHGHAAHGAVMADAAAGQCEHCGTSADLPAGISMHLQGMWFAFVLTAMLVAHFVGRISAALRQREREVSQMMDIAARSQRLAAMSTLAAGAAHELATPLGTIAVVAHELELVAKSEEWPAEHAEDLRLINAESKRCREILDRMAVSSGDERAESPRRTRVAEITEGALAAIAPERAQRVEVTSDAADRVLLVRERTLSQVLANLLDNAFDASDRAESVRLEITAGDREVVFQVEDRGAGMSDEVLARVGEPFFTTKEPGSGMGLGLFLAHAFVAKSNGRLDIDSAPNRGTRVDLRFPAEGRA